MSEVNQTEKEKYSITSMWNRKRNDKNELTCKAERERINMVAGGEIQGRDI